MTDQANVFEDENGQEPSKDVQQAQGENPYEGLGGAGVPKRAKHLSIPSHTDAVGHVRSRTVQSARDAAPQYTNQERIVRLDPVAPTTATPESRRGSHSASRASHGTRATASNGGAKARAPKVIVSDMPSPQSTAAPSPSPTTPGQGTPRATQANANIRAKSAPHPQAAPQARTTPQAQARTTPQAQPPAEFSSQASETVQPEQPPSNYAAQPEQAAAGFTPYATANGLEERTSSAGAIRARRKRRIVPIIVVAIFVVVGFAATLLWFNRPVTVTVNGATTEVRVGSTLKEVLQGQNMSPNPGDYVTVAGDVMSPNMGYAFSAIINGEELDPELIDDYRVSGGESIELGDGQDKVEEHTATSEVIKPYLRMEGTGYELQYISQWAEEGIIEHRVGKESGQEADVVTKEAKDCIITCRDLSIEGDQKYVALTFDDGPADPYTEQYLEILDRYGIKATFYNLGANIQEYPELAKRIVESGHQLANHTMDHNQLTADDPSEVLRQITTSAEVIEQTTGVSTTHIRPPYGDFSEKSWFASAGSITAAVRWSGDSEDWKLEGAASIVDKSLAGIHSGSIILMHDGGGERSMDVEALPILIERLQAEGYTFVTVSDLMRAAGDIPEDICSGTGTMPEGAVWPDEISPDDIAAAEAA